MVCDGGLGELEHHRPSWHRPLAKGSPPFWYYQRHDQQEDVDVDNTRGYSYYPQKADDYKALVLLVWVDDDIFNVHNSSRMSMGELFSSTHSDMDGSRREEEPYMDYNGSVVNSDDLVWRPSACAMNDNGDELAMLSGGNRDASCISDMY
ncbi:predicted protein [Lichtheimia corymbifera JMRC:FSU:9682]|uniref:Uncharacterized protein n=1 Tax=Lichtheimia corymbifera JMRC:FSU:9682 TaxID=1263082 RepID=A0A068SAR4_9FUNG|nr:predicted protein [Lichtheimia corymbifera JMRC:FSU:9682]